MASQTEDKTTQLQIDQIKADLKKAQQEGQVRSERIREIVRTAISESTTEVKQGSGEIRSLVKGVLAAVIDSFQERGKAVKEDLTASIEGIVEGISQPRRASIAQSETELKQIQAQISDQQDQLNAEIEATLTEIDAAEAPSDDTREAIQTAVAALRDSEEAALLRKRYAQLQAQLAILKANLAARYGEQYEDLKHHLDDAKGWYESSRKTADTSETTAAEQKQVEFEQKMGEAGTAIARKEKQIKQILKDLLHSVVEMTREDKPPR